MPTSQKATRDPKKTTAKDVPGSGMARKAGDAIEHRQAQRQDILRDAFGGGSKKKK